MKFDFYFNVGKEVLESVDLKDVFLVALVAIIALLIFLTPSEFQTALSLHYKNPYIPSFLTSAFVHAGISHLCSNLLIYLCAALFSLVLLSLSGRKKFFYIFFFIFVLFFPFVLSALNLHFIDTRIGRGLSGVVASFLGFIPVSIYLFLKEKISTRIRNLFPISLFLLGLGLAYYLVGNGITGKVIGTLSIFSISFLLLYCSLKNVRPSEISKMVRKPRIQGYLLLSLASFFIYLSGVAGLFPQNLQYQDGFVNVLSHYSGLVLGFIATYSYLIVKEFKE